VTGSRVPVGPLSHNKICNVEDFAHPDLLPVIRDLFAHEVVRFGDAFPAGKENRKDWEAAMALRAFAACDLLDGTGEFLGVAAGNEPLLFHLTRVARRVFSTDLYLAEGDWEVFGHRSMLTDPHEHWPFAWNPRRLVVQHMDALDLQYEDDSFDGVFSSSSIEHFGGHAEVERSMDEMFRVLRPGGVCAVSTEFRLAGPSPGIPGCLLFDRDEVGSVLIGDRAWSLISPLDLSVSEATMASKVDVVDVVAQQLAQCDRDGGWFTHKLDYAHFPHVVMGMSEFAFTSMQLALRKDAPADRPRGGIEASGTSPLRGTFTLSVDDAGFAGAGWQDPVPSPAGPVRFMGAGRDASIDMPVTLSPGAVVELLLGGGPQPDALDGLRVEMNGLPLLMEVTARSEGIVLRGVVPASYGSTRRFSRLKLRVPAVPAGESRRPGLALGSVTLRQSAP
jgi:SAM-dependent methyltransferase